MGKIYKNLTAGEKAAEAKKKAAKYKIEEPSPSVAEKIYDNLTSDEKAGDNTPKDDSPADENLTRKDKGGEELEELQEVNKVVVKKPMSAKQRKKIYKNLTADQKEELKKKKAAKYKIEE